MPLVVELPEGDVDDEPCDRDRLCLLLVVVPDDPLIDGSLDIEPLPDGVDVASDDEPVPMPPVVAPLEPPAEPIVPPDEPMLPVDEPGEVCAVAAVASNPAAMINIVFMTSSP